jgi:hypothetical protein
MSEEGSENVECDFCVNKEGKRCIGYQCCVFVCTDCTRECEDCYQFLCPDCHTDHEEEHAQDAHDAYQDELADGMGMQRCFECRNFFNIEDMTEHLNKCLD